MSTLQDRLKSFLEYLEIPMQTFERECGIGQGLGSKLSTKSYATTFKRISNAYPLLDIEWLRTGEGEMLVPGAVSAPSGCSAPPTDLGKALDEIAAQRRLLEKSQEQLGKSQEQIDRLISIIERMNERK